MQVTEAPGRLTNTENTLTVVTPRGPHGTGLSPQPPSALPQLKTRVTGEVAGAPLSPLLGFPGRQQAAACVDRRLAQHRVSRPHTSPQAWWVEQS